MDADVLFFNSRTNWDALRTVKRLLRSRTSRPNICLIIVTEGGQADAAYLIARRLQDDYKRFTTIVPGWCKSAGTLLVVGAHEVVITNDGQIGPLDVQIPKRDELGEAGSGLIVTDALADLQRKSMDTWRTWTLDIVAGTEGQVSFKTAAEIASKITIGLFSAIYGQIDPMYMGQAHRLMNVGLEYGQRLSKYSENITEECLKHLVEEYPDHGFAIDRTEAQSIFKQVNAPTRQQEALITHLGDAAERPAKTPIIDFLSEAITLDSGSETHEGTEPQQDRDHSVEGIRRAQELATSSGHGH